MSSISYALKRPRQIRQRIQDLEHRISMLRSSLEPHFGCKPDHVTGGQRSSMEDVVIRIVECEDAAKTLVQEFIHCADITAQLIECLPGQRERRIADLYYIQGKEVNDIVVQENVTRRHVNRVLCDAVKRIRKHGGSAILTEKGE